MLKEKPKRRTVEKRVHSIGIGEAWVGDISSSGVRCLVIGLPKGGWVGIDSTNNHFHRHWNKNAEYDNTLLTNAIKVQIDAIEVSEV